MTNEGLPEPWRIVLAFAGLAVAVVGVGFAIRLSRQEKLSRESALREWPRALGLRAIDPLVPSPARPVPRAGAGIALGQAKNDVRAVLAGELSMEALAANHAGMAWAPAMEGIVTGRRLLVLPQTVTGVRTAARRSLWIELATTARGFAFGAVPGSLVDGKRAGAQPTPASRERGPSSWRR